MNSINYSTIDEYLDILPVDEKQTLQKIRDVIHLIVPNCKERISYKICVFSVKKDLVGFASQKNHLSFYTMSPSLIKKMKKELHGYDVSGATIHFSPKEPLPVSLIEKILNVRIDEINKSSKSSKVTHRITEMVFELLEKHPEGLRWSELHSKIITSEPNFHPKTVNGCIWKLVERFPDKVYKPSKGVFRLIKYKS